MLHPVEMKKVRAICLKAHAPSVIKTLHNLSAIHLKDAQIPETERSGPLSSFDEISERHLKIRPIKDAMGNNLKAPKKKLTIENPLKEADELIAESEKLYSLLHGKEALQKDLDANIASQKALEGIESLEVDFSKLSSSALQFLLLRANSSKAKEAAASLSKRKNAAFAAAAPSKDGSQIFLVALPKSEDAKWLEQFGSISVLPLLSSTPKAELSALKGAEAQIREKIAVVEKKINRFIEANHSKVAAVEEALSIESERARISTMFSASSSLYYIEGWVEASKFSQLQSALKEKFGKKVLLLEAPIDDHHDMPPTKLQNHEQVKPFQFIVDFLSTTAYREIDPSIILAFTIPIIYALIFGDAGYAVFSFFFASFLMKKSKQGSLLYNIAAIWAISAIPAFIMGVVFDEYFGFTHEHLLSLFGIEHVQLYEGLHRVTSITTLMLICIIVGMVHLGLGFILGAINEWNHNKKHSIAKLCWLALEIAGFFTVAAFMFGAFPEIGMAAAALLVLSILGIIIMEGPIAAIEIPGLASNIMSYIRIAAVGVGGVILAEAVNELLLPHLELTPVGIIVFIITLIVYLAVHMAAATLAMFEAFVHGTRLNVVEFFGKFYKGTGIRFLPFSPSRTYSQEAS